MSASSEPRSTTETEMENTAAPSITEFPVPQKIQEMLQSTAPEALPMKLLIACMDKFVKFDENQSQIWQHMVATFEWAKKESNQVPQATDAQFLAQLVYKAKKGHYVFRDDETLKAGDMGSIYFRMHPNFKEISGRTKEEAEYLEHVRPILKAVGKFMYNTYSGKPNTCMAQTFDTAKLIEDCYDNCWKHQDRPNYGWTPKKMHRAFIFDPETFESNEEAGTVKFKDWSKLTQYHLSSNFAGVNKPGEWDVSANNKGKGENIGSNKHTAATSWEAAPTKLAKGMSKGSTKNDNSWGSNTNPYSSYATPYPQLWQHADASSSSTGLPNMNQGAGGNGKGQNGNAPWKQQDTEQSWQRQQWKE